MKDIFILLIVKSLGFFLLRMPYSFLEKLTECLAAAFLVIPSSRKRLLLSNLAHAFPKWDYSKILTVAKESSARMFEMGFFSLCYPFMSSEQRRRTVYCDEQTSAQLNELRLSGRPVLMLIPHTCLFETLATSPYFRPLGGRSLGAIYRPNKNPVLNKWVTKAREKVGIKTFARKEGIIGARAHLKNGNWLALLYDQNAGERGLGLSFLDRPCSISPLPDLLSKNTYVLCVHAISRRISFFRSKLELDIFEHLNGKTSKEVHGLLEKRITNCPKGLPEWLWSHGKWKVNDMAHEIFWLQEKLNPILIDIFTRKSNRLIIRMPNWLGDIVMAIPLLRAISSGRPDLHTTLLCKPQYAEWLRSHNFSHVVCPIEQKRGLQYYFQFLKLRKEYYDAQLNFTNSLRGDIESFIIGAPKRLGLQRRGQRPLLNMVYNPLSASAKHQTSVWADMLTHFGFSGKFDFSPSNICLAESTCIKEDLRILIAPGSQNTPDKRLATSIWIKICRDIFSNHSKYKPSVELLGTMKDSKICNEIEASLSTENIINSVGKTSILELEDRMSEGCLLICNDSGAMHLANMIGVPVIAIFSVTDPESTGPIFDSTKISLNQNDFNTEQEMQLAVSSAISKIIEKN